MGAGIPADDLGAAAHQTVFPLGRELPNQIAVADSPIARGMHRNARLARAFVRPITHHPLKLFKLLVFAEYTADCVACGFNQPTVIAFDQHQLESRLARRSRCLRLHRDNGIDQGNVFADNSQRQNKNL